MSGPALFFFIVKMNQMIRIITSTKCRGFPFLFVPLVRYFRVRRTCDRRSRDTVSTLCSTWRRNRPESRKKERTKKTVHEIRRLVISKPVGTCKRTFQCRPQVTEDGANSVCGRDDGWRREAGNRETYFFWEGGGGLFGSSQAKNESLQRKSSTRR